MPTATSSSLGLATSISSNVDAGGEVRGAARGEVVNDEHIIAPGQQPVDDSVRANEAGPPGHHHTHPSPPVNRGEV